MKAQARRKAARTAEREKLAAEIARHATVVGRLDQLRVAAGRADGLLNAAYAAKEKAGAALSEARANEKDFLLDQLVAGRELSMSPAVKAERDAKEADRAIDRAQQARDAVRTEFENAERDVELSKRRLDDAAGAALAADAQERIAAMLEEAKKVQDDLIARRAALRWLHQNGIIEPKGEVRDFLIQNDTVLPGTTGATEYQNYDEHPAALAWAKVCEALAHDADAPLPFPESAAVGRSRLAG